MKTKSRDYRKLQRARKRYQNTLKRTVNGYTKELLLADLYMKSVSRWFFKKYPVQMPKFKWMGTSYLAYKSGGRTYTLQDIPDFNDQNNYKK